MVEIDGDMKRSCVPITRLRRIQTLHREEVSVATVEPFSVPPTTEVVTILVFPMAVTIFEKTNQTTPPTMRRFRF